MKNIRFAYYSLIGVALSFACSVGAVAYKFIFLNFIWTRINPYRNSHIVPTLILTSKPIKSILYSGTLIGIFSILIGLVAIFIDKTTKRKYSILLISLVLSITTIYMSQHLLEIGFYHYNY